MQVWTVDDLAAAPLPVGIDRTRRMALRDLQQADIPVDHALLMTPVRVDYLQCYWVTT